MWLFQSQECLLRTPSLRRSTPTLTSLTTEELKIFAVRQAKLHLRWNRKPGWEEVFTSAGLTEEPGYGASLWLLPGGEDILLMSGSGEIKLYRVTLSDAGASLKHLAHTNLYLEDYILPGWKQFFYETTPHPLLAVWDWTQRYCLFPGGRHLPFTSLLTPLQCHSPPPYQPRE